MKSKCRTCLKKGKPMINIFTEENFISTQIMSITNVQIRPYDGLPYTICKICNKKLKNSIEFIKLCENSDFELRCRIKVDTFIDLDSKNIIAKSSENGENADKIDLSPTGNKTNLELDLEHTSNKKVYKSLVDNVNKQNVSKINFKHAVVSKLPVNHIINTVESKSEQSTYKNYLNIKYNPKIDIENEIKKVKSNLGNIIVKQRLFSKSKYSYVLSNKSKDINNKEINNENKIRISKHRQQQCSICGKITSSMYRLKTHLATHSEEQPFSCKYCHKKFALNQNLLVHLRTHTGEKPLKCTECGKQFAYSAGLLAHKRKHTGQMPYKCKICHQSFRNYTSLQYHIRSHADERNFECDICDRAFITRCNLQLHLHTHSGLRPHTCSYCNVNFSRLSNLKRHIRLVHKKEPD